MGTPLNIAEKLNAIRGDLRDFCHDVASHKFFTDKIGLKNTRYAHFQAVTMWVYVDARGIQPSMRFPQLESLLQENRRFSRDSEISKRMMGALDFLAKAFPDGCSYIRNRANTLSICMLASRVANQGIDGGVEATEFGEFVKTFFNDLSEEVEKGVNASDRELIAYQNAISSGSTGGDSIKTRLNVLTRRLVEYSPIFSPILGAHREVEEETVRSIGEFAEEIHQMLIAANRKYAASKGDDLFKMTTNVADSLNKFSIPVRDKQSYGDFIDSLYFVVYEGSGSANRLPDPIPEFSMEVKFLRGAIRHDLDHGDKREVKRKLKRAGDIFEKYSGKMSSDECGPDDFLAMQLRILSSMRSFLIDLV